jgi:hypothetical protein
MHGGKATGAPKANTNAWKNGNYSTQAKVLRQLARNTHARQLSNMCRGRLIVVLSHHYQLAPIRQRFAQEYSRRFHREAVLLGI